MKYLIYTSNKKESVYLFKSMGMTKKWPFKINCKKGKTETYYGDVIKIFKGKNYVKENYRCWPAVSNCRELTDIEFVTYRLLGYIQSDYERETIQKSNEEIKNSGTKSTS